VVWRDLLDRGQLMHQQQGLLILTQRKLGVSTLPLCTWMSCQRNDTRAPREMVSAKGSTVVRKRRRPFCDAACFCTVHACLGHACRCHAAVELPSLPALLRPVHAAARVSPPGNL